MQYFDIESLLASNMDGKNTYDEIITALKPTFSNKGWVPTEQEWMEGAQEMLFKLAFLYIWDKITWSHSWKVGALSAYFARSLGLNPYVFWVLGILHDWGKFVSPGRKVFLSTKRFSPEERAALNFIMQAHPGHGWHAIQKMPGDLEFKTIASEGALSHHEKWDGSGYPLKLEGEEISFYGRILAIADVFEARTAQRLYNKPVTVKGALEILERGSGSHFDPRLIKEFLKLDLKDLETFVRTNVYVKT